MSKQIKFTEEARNAMLAGASVIAKAVKSTLGPAGRNVVIQKPQGPPVITKDGVTVAKEVTVSDPFENLGAQLIKEVSSKTNDVAGDGTTSSAVLAEAIFKEGLRSVAAGANPISIQRGINKATANIVAAIQGISIPVQTSKEIEAVATVSANWDSEIGSIITQAVDKVGQDGSITVEEARGIVTSLEVVEGMEFDKGYLSPYFVNVQAGQKVSFDNPLILVTDKKINNIKTIIPVLEKASRSGKSLLIIADDVDGDALATLVVNSIRGTISVAAVKAPGFGDRKKAILQDIAVLTGATCLSDELGVKLEDITLDDLGTTDHVTVSANNTIITGGAGDKEAIAKRIAEIKHSIEETTSEYDREKLQERLAKLSGGIAVIKVGAATETEMKEKKDRIDDALHATRAAIEEGIVPGGGVALIRAMLAVSADAPAVPTTDEQIGEKIVYKAAEAPLRNLIENAGMDASIIIENVKNTPDAWTGYNVATRSYENLKDSGVVDPAKVTRVAIQNAASVAGLMLTTECAIVDVPDKKCSCEVPSQGFMM